MQPEIRSNATGAVDVGLRAFMSQIYNRMTLGVLVTSVTAYLVAATPALMQLLLGGPQAYIVMLAPLAIVWFGFNPMRMSSQALGVSFFAISALYGVSFSAIALVYTGESIARTFFVATGMFAGLSIFGYTTRKNLDGLGSFAIMGVWGVFILGLINLFVHSTGMQNLLSAMGIIAFSALVAWQTQSMKEMYRAGNGTEGNSRIAWAAALNLYISFIALFMYLLRFMGNSRN
jgi:FtsH-binding integral membrane protein